VLPQLPVIRPGRWIIRRDQSRVCGGLGSSQCALIAKVKVERAALDQLPDRIRQDFQVLRSSINVIPN
jgi:hypothetical protein